MKFKRSTSELVNKKMNFVDINSKNEENNLMNPIIYDTNEQIIYK